WAENRIGGTQTLQPRHCPDPCYLRRLPLASGPIDHLLQHRKPLELPLAHLYEGAEKIRRNAVALSDLVKNCR
ncbi:hypothetical protein, partial [Acidithiobacillus caldus]|uniref:hypothetical protein n=1 Tax=Acidithiobacillus caldus TaxID=33059 RepID=UPI001C06A5D3